MQRQLRWEVHSQDHPETHEYNILIINEDRKIETILQRASEQLMPADDFQTLTRGHVLGTRLKYQLVKILAYGTSPHQVDWKKIYRGKVVRDRELRNRKNIDGLPNYVDQAIARNQFS
ncbi:MAG: hypothetical protein KJ600_03150 [Nanoarchaeota archaeon]|nr:hypothetical protein [Nanoarchaeota archaeon]MBU1103524.1 hypothetical protein [Nanoarchaeota archaeon]